MDIICIRILIYVLLFTGYLEGASQYKIFTSRADFKEYAEKYGRVGEKYKLEIPGEKPKIILITKKGSAVKDSDDGGRAASLEATTVPRQESTEDLKKGSTTLTKTKTGYTITDPNKPGRTLTLTLRKMPSNDSNVEKPRGRPSRNRSKFRGNSISRDQTDEFDDNDIYESDADDESNTPRRSRNGRNNRHPSRANANNQHDGTRRRVTKNNSLNRHHPDEFDTYGNDIYESDADDESNTPRRSRNGSNNRHPSRANANNQHDGTRRRITKNNSLNRHHPDEFDTYGNDIYQSDADDESNTPRRSRIGRKNRGTSRVYQADRERRYRNQPDEFETYEENSMYEDEPYEEPRSVTHKQDYRNNADPSKQYRKSHRTGSRNGRTNRNLLQDDEIDSYQSDEAVTYDNENDTVEEPDIPRGGTLVRTLTRGDSINRNKPLGTVTYSQSEYDTRAKPTGKGVIYNNQNRLPLGVITTTTTTHNPGLAGNGDSFLNRLNNLNMNNYAVLSRGFRTTQDVLESAAHASPLGKILGPMVTGANIVTGLVNEGNDKIMGGLYNGVRSLFQLNGEAVVPDYDHRPKKQKMRQPTVSEQHEKMEAHRNMDELEKLLPPLNWW